MAFVSTLRPLPARIFVDTIGSSTVVLESIGFDDAKDGVAYFLSVVLDVMAGGGHELTFSVVETSDEGERILWGGLDTRPILGRSARSEVRERLLAIVEYLVGVVHPESISMFTVDTHLPENALVKYRLICDRIVALGFELEPPEVLHGQWSWTLRRKETP